MLIPLPSQVQRCPDCHFWMSFPGCPVLDALLWRFFLRCAVLVVLYSCQILAVISLCLYFNSKVFPVQNS